MDPSRRPQFAPGAIAAPTLLRGRFSPRPWRPPAAPGPVVVSHSSWPSRRATTNKEATPAAAATTGAGGGAGAGHAHVAVSGAVDVVLWSGGPNSSRALELALKGGGLKCGDLQKGGESDGSVKT